MKRFKTKVILPALILAATATAGYSSTSMQDLDAFPASLNAKVDSVQASLEESGYEVLRGDWNLFTMDDCKYAIQKFGNCFGNNPAVPYIIPTLPLWDDEFKDHYMKDILGSTQGKTWWTHRFDEREAVIILGHLPPEGGYFGLQTYVFTRQGKINTKDEIYQSLTDNFVTIIRYFMPRCRVNVGEEAFPWPYSISERGSLRINPYFTQFRPGRKKEYALSSIFRVA